MRHEAMDPDLEEEWTTTVPYRDYACTALSRAQDADKGKDHPHALRYVVGLTAGWEERKAALVARRDAASAEE